MRHVTTAAKSHSSPSHCRHVMCQCTGKPSQLSEQLLQSDLCWVSQANKGAKNHAVIMPDANPEATASALIGASMGAAGQRCMAISAAVFVGGIGKYKDALISKAKKLKVSAGHEPGTDVGPVITVESKKRVEDLIESGVQQVCCPLVLDETMNALLLSIRYSQQ